MASPGPEFPRTPSTPVNDTLKNQHGLAGASDVARTIRSPPRNGIPPKRKSTGLSTEKVLTPSEVRASRNALNKAASRTTASGNAKRSTTTASTTSSVQSRPRPASLVVGDAATSPKSTGENENPGQGRKHVSIVEPPGSKSPTKKRSVATIDRRSVFGRTTVRDLSTAGARAKPGTSSMALRTANSTTRPSGRPSLSQSTSRPPRVPQSKGDSKVSSVSDASFQATAGRPPLASPPRSHQTPASVERPKRPGLAPRKSTQSQTIEQRLREMSVVHQMLRIAMAEAGDENDSEKEEYGRQVDESLAGIREKLEEARRQEGKAVEVDVDSQHDETQEQSMSQIRELEERLAVSDEAKEQLTETVNKLQTELRELEEVKSELGDHVSSLRSESNDKDHALSSLQSSLENVTSEFSSRMADVRLVTDEQYEKYQVVRDRLNHASTRIDAFGDKMEKSVVDLQRDKDASISHLRKVVDRLQDQIQELHEQNERDLSDLKAAMQDELQKTVDDLHVAHDEESSQAQRSFDQEAHSTAQEHAKALEDLRERLTAKRVEQSRAVATQIDRSSQQDEALQTTEVFSGMVATAELESIKEDHEAAMSSANDRIEELMKRLENTHKQLTESQDTIRNLLEAKTEDDQASDELESRMSRLQEDMKIKEERDANDRKHGAEARDRLIAESEGLRQQIELLNDSLAAKEAQLQSTTSRARELSQQARTAHQASERHRSITVKTMDDLKTAQAQVSKLRHESKDHEVIALKEAVKFSQQHQTRAAEELQTAKETVDQQESRVQHLLEVIEQLQEEKEGTVTEQRARIQQSEGQLEKRQSESMQVATHQSGPINGHTGKGSPNILGNMAACNAQIQNLQGMNDDLATLQRQSLQRLNAVRMTRRIYDDYGLPVSPSSMSGEGNGEGNGGFEGDDGTDDEEEL